MIVYADKGYQTRSDCPSEDWSGGGAKYVVADGSELALKIERLYPNYDFVEEAGELVDVVEVGPPEPSEEEKRFRYEARTVGGRGNYIVLTMKRRWSGSILPSWRVRQPPLRL